MAKDFFSCIENRRTIYGIGKDKIVPESKIEELVTYAVKHTPSAFNSQSARIVLLFGGEHSNLWSITMEALRKIVPAEKFAPTEEKINSFAGGYGTVLCFDDTAVVNGLQEKFPSYKDNFPVWAQQSNGMLQFVIWTALESEGLGASLQHYTELIEAEVKKTWSIPDSWKMIAQMPFGCPTASPSEKTYLPVESRMKIFK